MIKLRNLILIATLLLPLKAAFADWESILFPKDFQTENNRAKATATAQQSGKHVIVYATRTNCPPCDALRYVLRTDSVAKQFRDAYVFTAVWNSSMGNAEREDYRNRYGVQGAPTWIIFTNTGKYVCTAPGVFLNAEEANARHKAIQARLANVSETSPTGPERCS